MDNFLGILFLTWLLYKISELIIIRYEYSLKFMFFKIDAKSNNEEYITYLKKRQKQIIKQLLIYTIPLMLLALIWGNVLNSIFK